MLLLYGELQVVHQVNEIDVLLPVKEPAPWLAATLGSLNAQTYTHWRLVVVVHGQSAYITETISKMIRDYKILHCEISEALPTLLNTGLSECKSRYIARIDSDDLAHPDRFLRQIRFMDSNKDCVVVGSCAVLIDGKSDEIGMRYVATNETTINRKLPWKTPLIHPSVLMRRDAVVEAGGYSVEAKNAEDYELWLRLAKIGKICNLSELLLSYRMHGSQVSASSAIPFQTFVTVSNSNAKLSQYQGKSKIVARMKSFIWYLKQLMRGLGRKVV
jgi:glycosyltransferase involved in cell wall biosynthesis